MLRSKIGVWRLLALVAVVILIQAHAASNVSVASSQGRDQAECVQACNLIEDACKGTVQDDCLLSYTPGTPEYDACNSAGVEICKDAKQVCKAKCNVNRPDEHPTEP
jgi:hypothetical protein